MVQNRPKGEIRVVSGADIKAKIDGPQMTRRAQSKGEETPMKNLFRSAVLTAVAVPFLVAAPAPKAQNSTAQSTDTTQTTATTTTKKTHKHHNKKNKGTTESSTTESSTTANK